MRWIFVLALTGATAGCATVTNDQREYIPVRSDRAGAVVSVDCGNAPIYGGITPAVIILERTADPCSITIAKEGYQEKSIDLQRQISRATLGNKVPGVLTGALFGLVAVLADLDGHGRGGDVIDAAEGGMELGEGAANAVDRKTGAAYKHVPGEIFVKLDPLP
jgi:hypothetical protein